MADDDIRVLAPTAAMDERDTFLVAALPLLLGACVHVKDHATWCATHDSLWLSEHEHCARFGDMDNFADSVIEAWEGRHGRTTTG
jgi:hypothetical protein